MTRGFLPYMTMLTAILWLAGGIVRAEAADTPENLPKTDASSDAATNATSDAATNSYAPNHYIWKEGHWGRLVLEQNAPAHWTATEGRDFLQRPKTAAHQPAADARAAPPHAASSFQFTPRRAERTSSVVYDTTLPYSKGTQLRAGIDYAAREDYAARGLPFQTQYAQETSLGLRLRNGQFELASLYLLREQQGESEDYQLNVYNVTASWHLTPSTRLGIGYNRGAREERLTSSAGGASERYESMMVGGTTHFAIAGGLDLGYFYHSGPDKRHTRPDGKLFQDNYTGLLLNLQF